MRKIQDQLMKNLLTHWGTEEKNRKILSMFGQKLLNLQVRYFLERKPRRDQAEKRSKTFLLA